MTTLKPRDRGHDGLVLRLCLRLREDDRVRGLPLIWGYGCPDLLNPRRGVGVRCNDSRSGHPDSGQVLLLL